VPLALWVALFALAVVGFQEANLVVPVLETLVQPGRFAERIAERFAERLPFIFPLFRVITTEAG
jgi:hypothetical protein